MVNIYKLKLTNLQDEILRLLFTNAGVKLNHRQIAKRLDVSQTAVKKALPELETKSMITSVQDSETKRWSVELNRDNHTITQLKRAENLKMIYETGLVDFLEQKLPGATIILFGSYSRGEDTINSDIDIAVIGRKEKNIDLETYEQMLQRDIIINYYDDFSSIHTTLKENLFNGIVLRGAVEL